MIMMIVMMVIMMLMMRSMVISNSTKTEWSITQGVIVQVISKSDERKAVLKIQPRLLPELYDTIRGPITNKPYL